MSSESEVQRIVSDAASRLGMPLPRLSLVPAKVSFMPVLVLNSGVTITPAARQALSAEALEFAVVHGLVSAARMGRGTEVSRIAVPILAVATGLFVSSSMTGAARAIVGVIVSIVAVAAYFFALAWFRSKWPSSQEDRMVLQHIRNLDGAREYARITDRFDLNGMVPEEWSGPHGRLVDLERLERTARSMGLPYA